jgi:SNF2 family DNA or RNA helicase
MSLSAIQKQLKKDLIQCVRFSSVFAKVSKKDKPTQITLTTATIYLFLKQIVPRLQRAGFGVMVPKWWGKPESQPGIILNVTELDDKSINSGLFNPESLVQYDWQLSIGKENLTPEEFAELVALKTPLVQIRGLWAEMNPKEVDQILSFMKLHSKNVNKKKKTTITIKKAFQLSFGNCLFDNGIHVFDVRPNGSLRELFQQLTNFSKITPIVQPLNFRGILRPYQITGVSWMVFMRQFQFGVCLADDMGLGKTIQVIALLLHDQETHIKVPQPKKGSNQIKKQQVETSLLICPLSLLGNWAKELKNFAPTLKCYIHHGETRLGGNLFLNKLKDIDIVITTYGQVVKDKTLLSRVKWENIILDEAQNIKTAKTNQARAVKNLQGLYRIAMTGTPIENRLTELWSIMDFLNPGYLGSLSQFHESFSLPIEKYHDEAQMDHLKQLIQPFIMRRLKTDKNIIQDLPEKVENKIYTHLTQEQASLYEACVQDMMAKLDEMEGIQRKGIILATLTKLKQICNHPVQFLHERNPRTLKGESLDDWFRTNFEDRSGKLIQLIEMLQNVLARKEKALIFTQFSEMGAFLQAYLSYVFHTEVMFLFGGTSQLQRDLMVQQFQQPASTPAIFILSLKAGGLGLNLTAANNVFHFDRWWNPAIEEQATDRIYRIGQTHNVFITKFVSLGTLEEKIDLMLEQKKELSEKILRSGEGWITDLSTDKLRDLLTLRYDSVRAS